MLEDFYKVIREADSMLAPCYGPSFRQTLIRTETGRHQLTRSGLKICQSVQFKNTLVRVMQSCMEKYHKQCGDGSKTFVLWTAEILSHLMSEISIKERRKMIDTLLVAQRVFVPLLIQRIVDYDELRVTCTGQDLCDELIIHCQQVCLNSLIGRIASNSTAKHFAQIMTDLICGVFKTNKNFSAVIHLLIALFDVIFLADLGQTPMKSRVQNGLVLSRTFLDHHTPDNGRKNDVKFVILRSHDSESDTDDDEKMLVSLKHNRMVTSLMQLNMQRAAEAISRLKVAGIGLIISEYPLSEALVDACTTADVHVVSYVPIEELQWLATVSNVEPIHTLSCMLTAKNIGYVQKCSTIIVNGRQCMLLEGFYKDSIVLPQSSFVIVCGLMEAVTTQLREALRATLQCLIRWTDNCDISFTCKKCGTLENGKETVIESTYAINQSSTHRWIAAGEGESETRCQHLVSVRAGGGVEMFWAEELWKLSRSAAVSDESSRIAVEALQRAFLAVPLRLANSRVRAAKCRQLGLARMLWQMNKAHILLSPSRTANSTANTEYNDHWDSETDLLDNQNSARDFVAEKISDFKENVAYSLSLEPLLYDPVSSKITLLYSVLNFVQICCNIDSILPVRKGLGDDRALDGSDTDDD